ncbi:DNA repair metallo-beta-lactamase-domain-containing protein [Phlebopus sp. FC_14]|nr:DNA repair metallo-beta-lactamase-domain-containing protein [Phlebopus sp. FC_14]
MTPPAKKRKEPPKIGTLLDFFSNPTSSKRKRIHPPRPQTKGKGKANLNVAPSCEVIVISDSDDDLKTGSVSGSRERIVEPSRQQKAGVPACQLPHTVKTGTTEDNDCPITFGNPSALLNPVDHSNLESLSRPTLCPLTLECNTLEHSSTIFGAASTLLQSPSDDSSAALSSDGEKEIKIPLACGSLSEHHPGDTLLSDVSYINSKGSAIASKFDGVFEEWAAGDDEILELEVLGQEINLDSGYDENTFPGQTSKEHVTCPVCSARLPGMHNTDIQSHVNECLDASNGNVKEPSHGEDRAAPVSVEQKPIFVEPTSSKAAPFRGDKDLYSVLMTSYKENEAWREADVVEDRNFRPTQGNRRKAPFYKVLQGMPIAVDAFRYGTIPGVTAYFLTHAHSDHYTNLSSNWKSGPIYCSEDTANLIIHMLAVDRKWVHPMRMDEPTIIPNTGCVTVTLVEANHCPGSCLFLFEGPQTVHAGDTSFKSPFVGSSRIFRYLHCGDFRASPRHVLHPAVKGKFIDHIYLDTTYLDPKYTFPPQPLVISACAELVCRVIAGELIGRPDVNGKRNSTVDSWINHSASAGSKSLEGAHDRVLVVVGTYSVGKERIVKAVAQALKTKIYCDARKAAILRCQNDPELHALLTADPAEGGVHMLPLGMISSDRLKSYIQGFKGIFSRAVGFRPTGWTYSPPSGTDLDPSVQSIISRGQSRSFSYADLRPMQKSTYNIQMFGVPYSEHSSFLELNCFAMSCQWGKMIATVNVGNESSRAKMVKWVERWEAERKRTKEIFVQPRAPDYW